MNLYVLIPIVLGMATGYIFSWQIVLALTGIGIVFSVYAIWSTKDQEIGGLIGVIVAAVVFYFCMGMWPVCFVMNGFFGWHLFDLSWLFRK